MADIVVIIGVVAFFAISALYVAGLDRLIGRDDENATNGVAGQRVEIEGVPGTGR